MLQPQQQQSPIASSPSHHHQPRAPPLWIPPGAAGHQHAAPSWPAVGLARNVGRVPLAVGNSHELEVVVAQCHAADAALETLRVELGAALRLDVLALDARVAAAAQRPVELVVVARAVRLILEHVKVGRHKRRVARHANEALLVPAPGEAAISRLDAFTDNCLSASTAVALGRPASTPTRRIGTRPGWRFWF